MIIHPLLHEIGRLYLDDKEQNRFSREAERILLHSIDDDAIEPWRKLSHDYFPVLHLGGGATRDAIRLVCQLDEVFRHLQPSIAKIFTRFTVPGISSLESCYFCFAVVHIVRVCNLGSIEEIKGIPLLIECLDLELRRVDILKRDDMSM